MRGKFPRWMEGLYRFRLGVRWTGKGGASALLVCVGYAGLRARSEWEKKRKRWRRTKVMGEGDSCGG